MRSHKLKAMVKPIPILSPDDEFADYENWDVANLDISQLKTPDMLQG